MLPNKTLMSKSKFWHSRWFTFHIKSWDTLTLHYCEPLRVKLSRYNTVLNDWIETSRCAKGIPFSRRSRYGTVQIIPATSVREIVMLVLAMRNHSQSVLFYLGTSQSVSVKIFNEISSVIWALEAAVVASPRPRMIESLPSVRVVETRGKVEQHMHGYLPGSVGRWRVVCRFVGWHRRFNSISLQSPIL